METILANLQSPREVIAPQIDLFELISEPLGDSRASL